MPKYSLISFFAAVLCTMVMATSVAQVPDPEGIKKMISRYKVDPRGPYLDIRWFCQDGSTRAARDPCPDEPGNQRARYKPAVLDLATKHHVFLGQILTKTPFSDFWDEKNAHSRIKQYALEKYLQSIDNGWINRKARYYRGAIQIEDENNWGIGFFTWLLDDSSRIKSKYYLIRQSARYIPHAVDDNNARVVRTLSGEISDSLTSFRDIRIKIHNMPDSDDIKRVQSFIQKNKGKIPEKLMLKINRLVRELKIMYQPFQVAELEKYRKILPQKSTAEVITSAFMRSYSDYSTAKERCLAISNTAFLLRIEIVKPASGKTRLAMLDIINKLEGLLMIQITGWEVNSLRESTRQVYCLAEAAAAFGFLELWEWQQLQSSIIMPIGDSISLSQFSRYTERTSRAMQWCTAMAWAHYKPVISVFREFEPLAVGFYDELVRSSVLLRLGEKCNQLSEVYFRKSGFPNAIFGNRSRSSVRGINPGYAEGELVVVRNPADKITYSPHNIYVFMEPPANLKPVAGVLSVSEGNPVSHIQLLARNLGIPSAVISGEDVDILGNHAGSRVFFAVSSSGTVIMKPASSMDFSEKELFREKMNRNEKISVPVHRIRLDQTKILNLREIRAAHSGEICGPKAANAGQLKSLFPDHVAEGIVLPFGIFRQHMDQRVPGQNISYWQKMTEIFSVAARMREQGDSEITIEKYLFARLDTLRSLIRKMPFLPDFKTNLEQQFILTFRQPMGKVPVFVRSDTNMEDLKDFTGAGLNLTVFNVLDTQKIMQGIRDVWASPYTERSYSWRQKFLLNPENVFPSILIMPGINADKSGVIITKGVTTGGPSDMTIAFNRGVGGAVDGQAAESWLISEKGEFQLISPARELSYLSIPETGGSIRLPASLQDRILTEENLTSLSAFFSGMKSLNGKWSFAGKEGPFDIELAFKNDKIWLFQIRPYVENKQAAASEYLQKISPSPDQKGMLALDDKINI